MSVTSIYVVINSLMLSCAHFIYVDVNWQMFEKPSDECSSCIVFVEWCERMKCGGNRCQKISLTHRLS